MIKFKCAYCNKMLSATDESQGEARNCDHCGEAVTVPYALSSDSELTHPERAVPAINWNRTLSLALGFGPATFMSALPNLSQLFSVDNDGEIAIIFYLLFSSPIWIGGYSLAWSMIFSKVFLGAKNWTSVIGYAVLLSVLNCCVGFAGCTLVLSFE